MQLIIQFSPCMHASAGLDYLNVAAWDEGIQTHHVFLERRVRKNYILFIVVVQFGANNCSSLLLLSFREVADEMVSGDHYSRGFEAGRRSSRNLLSSLLAFKVDWC